MNLGEIVARCADMMARADLTDQIRSEVQLAVARYERELWYFTETRAAAIQLEAGRTWYDSARIFSEGSGWDLGRWDLTAWDAVAPTLLVAPVTRLLSVDYMRIKSHIGGLDDEMHETRYALFEAWNEGSASVGQPTNYTRYTGQIGVWPTPVGADVLYLSGKFKPLAPVTDGDRSIFFTEARELIESCAVANVYEKFLRDIEAAAPHRQREALNIAALRGEGVHKMSTRRIKANY